MDILLPVVLSALIALLVSLITFSSKLGELKATIKSNNDRISRLETKFDNYMLGLAMSPEKGPSKIGVPPEIDELLRKLENYYTPLAEKGNPISPKQMQRLSTYRSRIAKGLPLKAEEYRDFQSLLREVGEELPKEERNEFDSVVAGLSGFVAGMTTASSVWAVSRPIRRIKGKALTTAYLVEKVAEEVGLAKKDVNNVVDAMTSAISDSLAGGEKVTLVGFGTFQVQKRKARQGVNPQTGDKISIPAKDVPKFKAGKSLREAVE